MDIIECKTDAEIMMTFDMMHQLRPHVNEDQYLPLIRTIEGQGGRLIAAMQDGVSVGCSLFRQETRLFTGPLIYVDDLVADENTRSKGVAHALLAWIEKEAKTLSIKNIALDTGVQRGEAHKFYFREGFQVTSFNFKKSVG